MINIRDYVDGHDFKGYFDKNIESIVINTVNSSLNERKSEESFNILHSPDFTYFKKVYKRHTNFCDSPGLHMYDMVNNSALLSLKYHLDEIHIKRPQIYLNDYNINHSLNNYFIKMIQEILDITEEESIKKIKKFNGNIYKTIILG